MADAARRDEQQQPALVLAKPPKKIGEMSDQELLDFAGRIWDAAVAAPRPDSPQPDKR